MILIDASERFQYEAYQIDSRYKGLEDLPRQVIVCRDEEEEL